MKNLVVCILLMLVRQQGSSQDLTQKVLVNDADWGQGSIMLNDGRELKGAIRYNEKTGIVSFESGKVSKSLTSRNLVGFEYFDERQSRQRVFYSLPYEDPTNNIETNLIFEVLRQFKDFAVLTKTDPFQVKQNTNNNNNPNPTFLSNDLNSNSIKVTQVETIYFMEASGTIKPYCEITRKEVEKALFDRSVVKSKIVDKKLLQQYLKDKFADVTAYAKKEDLDLDTKEDFLKILDYYQGLLAKE